MEAEHYSQAISSTTHAWLTDTVHSGYTGTAYIQALPDLDIPAVVPSTALSTTAQANYPINLPPLALTPSGAAAVAPTPPGTHSMWASTRSSPP